MIGPGAAFDSTPTLSPELLSKLADLRSVLEVQGIVQRHHGHDRRAAYRLRYRVDDLERGCRVHRSLPLGDETVAHEVQKLIDGWRQERERRNLNQALIDSMATAHDRARRGLVRRVANILHRMGASPEVQREAIGAVMEGLEDGRMIVMHATAACHIVAGSRSK